MERPALFRKPGFLLPPWRALSLADCDVRLLGVVGEFREALVGEAVAHELQ